MAQFYEPVRRRREREERDRQRYSEAQFASPDELFRINRANVRDGLPLTGFGQQAMDTFLRQGVPQQEVEEIEAETQRDFSHLSSSAYLSQFRQFQPRTPPPPEPDFRNLAEVEGQLIQAGREGFQRGFSDEDRTAARSERLMADLQANAPSGRALLPESDPNFEIDPRIAELREARGVPDLISGIQSLDPRALLEGVQSAPGRAFGELTSGLSDIRALGGADRDIGQLLSDPTDLQTAERLGGRIETGAGGVQSALRGTTGLAGVDPQAIAERPFAFLSGRDAVETWLRNATFGEVGLEAVGLGEETTPRLVNELIEALAPINIAIAGSGSGAAATVRGAKASILASAATPGRSRAARITLNRIAGVLELTAGAIEPFAGQGIPALGREVAADVAAQEAFFQTEGAPTLARFGVAAVAGGVAGFSPEIASGLSTFGVRTAIEAPEAVAEQLARFNALPDTAAIRAADPTASTRAAGEIARPTILPEVRLVPAVTANPSPPGSSSVSLFRGDSSVIDVFELERTSQHGLFGQGIYLTDNPDVAGTYTVKGLRPGATPDSLRISRFDVPRSRLGRAIDAEAAITPEIRETLIDIWRGITESPEGLREAAAAAEAGLQSPVSLAAFTDAIDLSNTFANLWNRLGELTASVNRRVPGSQPPQGLALFVQRRFREEMFDRGFTGIRYNGGARIGGAGEHTAYVLWDDAVINAQRVTTATQQAQPPLFGAKALPESAVANVLDPSSGQVRGLPAIAGGAEEATDPTLDAARTRLFEAFREERTIDRIGIATRELREGRARQARGVQSELDEAIASGVLGAEEIVAQARQGAATGQIRETFAQPINLMPAEREAIFGEVARMLSDGDIDSFEFLNLTEAVDRLLKGEGLRPFEVASDPLRALVGIEVVEAAARRPVRQTLAQADAKIRRETDRFIEQAQRAETRALQAQQRNDLKSLDARIASLDEGLDATTPIGVRASFIDPPVRARELRQFNDVDAQLRRETERFNEQALRRQENARNAAEAKSFNDQRRVREALDNTAPSVDQLTRRIDTIMDRQQPGTPQGARELGESGKSLGTREPSPFANVPEELRAEVSATLTEWLKASTAVLDNMSTDGMVVLRTINAQINGTLNSPFLNEAIYQRTTIKNVLINLGLEERVAQQLSDALFDRHMAERFGDSFTAIRRARAKARTDIKAEFRMAREEPIGDQALDLAVDQRLRETMTPVHGTAAVANEREITRQLALTQGQTSLNGLRHLVQQTKNTMFGIDFAIFGIQGMSAVFRGGVPLLAKMSNDILAALHMPHARIAYSEANLSKQVQFAIDGVDQTISSSAMRPDEGSLLNWIPGFERNIPGVGDSIAGLYTRLTSRLNDFQFGTVLTAIRNSAYEGDLIMLHLLGRDVSDPLVRARAARSANHIGSAARPALRTGRKELESIAVTSAQMTRARFANINEMAKVLTANNYEDRILAAMTIVSAVGYTMTFGQYMNNLIGVGEFEWNPAEGGFGTITTANGRVIDMVPQDSVVRAFARSIKEIQDGDIEGATQAWAKVYLGSSSIVGRVPPALAGVGFEPGSGFKFGDLTRTGTILNLAPLPPILGRTIVEGWDAMGSALDSVGIGNFEESAFSERQRTLDDLGVDTEALSGKQENEIIEQQLGPEELAQLESRRVEELKALAGRGDRKSQALLLSVELRDELTRIANDSATKAEYRDRRRVPIQQYIGAQDQYDDVFRSFGESDDPIQRLAGERYALRDQALIGSELDFDVLEELQGTFDAALAPTERELMMDVINAVDVRDHPWEQEYDLLTQELGASGWWDIRTVAWDSTGFSEATGFATYDDWRSATTNGLNQLHTDGGFSPGRAREEADEEFNKLSLKEDYDEVLRMSRLQWMLESPANIELIDRALEWGLWSNAPKDAEDLIDATLIGRN